MTHPKSYDITKLERPVREALELIMELEASEQTTVVTRLTNYKDANNLRNRLYGLCRLVFGRTGHVELSIKASDPTHIDINEATLYARLKDIDLDI